MSEPKHADRADAHWAVTPDDLAAALAECYADREPGTVDPLETGALLATLRADRARVRARVEAAGIDYIETLVNTASAWLLGFLRGAVDPAPIPASPPPPAEAVAG